MSRSMERGLSSVLQSREHREQRQHAIVGSGWKMVPISRWIRTRFTGGLVGIRRMHHKVNESAITSSTYHTVYVNAIRRYSSHTIRDRYSSTIGPDVFYVEEAQETLKHMQKIGVTTLASKWITSNARPEVIQYEEHTTTKPSSSLTENLFGLIKSSDAQAATSKPSVNPIVNKKSQESPSISKKRGPEESPMISGSGELQFQDTR